MTTGQDVPDDIAHAEPAAAGATDSGGQDNVENMHHNRDSHGQAGVPRPRFRDDQASKLRKLMSQVRSARIVAVASGKGGVGKSNIALNLSILLSAAGNRVALVDADLGLANLDVLLDVDIRANLSHVIAGTRRLDEIIMDLP